MPQKTLAASRQTAARGLPPTEAPTGVTARTAHRMTGSATRKTLFGETLLRAWKRARGLRRAKSSLRTWLHRIATNTCLTALEGRRGQHLPTGLRRRECRPSGELMERREVSWLEPAAGRDGRPY